MKSLFRVHPTVLLMASAHMMVDGYGNIYAPLLPLLIPKLNLTLFMAGTLTMLFQLAASVAQLGFGHLADHWRPRTLIMLGPVVSVTVLSLIGLAPSVGVLAIVLMVGGLGGAAFHPPAAALAHRLGGDRPGRAMSVHIAGGNLGFALGPLLFAPAAQYLGLQWTPALAIPGLIVVAFFLSRVPNVTLHDSDDVRRGVGALGPHARTLSFLYAIVVLRTLTSLAYATYVPVMLTARGLSLTEAGAIVSAYLLAGGAGGLLGGPAADRYGARPVIAWSLALSAPLLIAAPWTSGWTFAILLAIGGFFLQASLPVNVIVGQSLVPESAATVSSLMMGFGWGTGGVAVPLIGALADRFGIAPALTVLGLVPLVGAALAMPLPAHAGLARRGGVRSLEER
ncbi:MAG: MFS transporter [Vicinamibacterales bacterium]